MAYGIRHEPLLALVQANRRRGGDPVAIVQGRLCFFERGSPIPEVGTTVEVMIVAPVHPMDAEGNFRDFDRVSAIRVRAVDPARHVLVATDGFEQSGSMCSTTAFGCETDGSRQLVRADAIRGVGRNARELRDCFTLTPGRSGIRYAHNVSPAFYGRSPEDTIPTNVWVDRDERTGRAQRRSRVAGDSPTVRVAGLTRFEDLECASVLRAPRMAA